ncbi:MAG: hypothetical protein AAGB35_05490 [Pseudomonadota bacterium]
MRYLIFICVSLILIGGTIADVQNNKHKENKANVLNDKDSSLKPYKLISVIESRRNENIECTWQAVKGGPCPPYVIYYDQAQSDTLKLHIKNGKLYQGKDLFDTSDGDTAHTYRHVALIVMNANGEIYASNQNKRFLFHHSSILGGRDLAFAGEIQVEQGVITNLTNCSGHYRPKFYMTYQILDSLVEKGYLNKIPVNKCHPRFIDLDYNDIPTKEEN